MAKILSVGCAIPPHAYSQKTILGLLKNRFGENRAAEKIFSHRGIERRHSVLSGEVLEALDEGKWSTGERNAIFAREAPGLAAAAAKGALQGAGISPADVDLLIITTCTGCITPGLDIIMASQFGMKTELRRLHIGGMGCYAAFPALKAARDGTGNSQSVALLISVEICSIHVQPTDDLNNIVSSSLFADGAAAVLISGKAKTGAGLHPVILETLTWTDYQTMGEMTWNVGDHGFVMTLSSKVPPFIGARIGDFVKTLVARHHLSLGDVRHWVVHPGGARILDAVQVGLKLSDAQMFFSRCVLRDFGNMSSATVFFILDRVQKEAKPQSGEFGVMLGFGPGLTLEGALIRWE